MEILIQSAAAFLAIFGFAIILDAPKKFLFYAGAAGGVGWLAYLLTLEANQSVILAAFLSSLSAAVLSHLFARKLKAPVTVFLVAGILPAVPGASIYRCVYYLIQRQTMLSTYHLMQTLQIAGAMALAIFIVDSLFRLMQKNTADGMEEKAGRDSSDCGCSSRRDPRDGLPVEHPFD